MFGIQGSAEVGDSSADVGGCRFGVVARGGEGHEGEEGSWFHCWEKVSLEVKYA